MNKKKIICVIGAGISGLSTASLLMQLGYQVHIISKDDPRSAALNPEFSSLFPAASIIPHAVNSDELNEVFSISKNYFETLYSQRFPGVTKTKHYELFSYHKEVPDYANVMEQFRIFNEFRGEFYPEHPDHHVKSGWRFETYFADWPLYFPALIQKVLNKVSGFEIKELKTEDLPALPFDVIVNCTEIGSIDLFGDTSGRIIHRGHLINIPGAATIMDPKGDPVSYNYYPGKQVYRSESGCEQDVYCYSRNDGLVLGGSRQKGYINENREWQGEENVDPVTNVQNLELPTQIIEIHKEILKFSFDYELPPVSEMHSKLGYRFTRSTENGLRIQAEEVGDKLVIHNYGHGGAGVTLSWGCAQKVSGLLQQLTW
ncbi:FAD-dependent oxidoreductase [Gracilimonas sp. Q87]|uniref:FAD-dependent oxidoreductase n=1 Tax=Gracilimonas sp. Q87 TaxID=3384766 RepID=UPI0039842BA9